MNVGGGSYNVLDRSGYGRPTHFGPCRLQSLQVFLAFLKLKIRTEIIILLNNGIFRFNLKVTTTMYAGLFSTVYYYRYFRHAEADKRTYLLAYLLTYF